MKKNITIATILIFLSVTGVVIFNMQGHSKILSDSNERESVSQKGFKKVEGSKGGGKEGVSRDYIDLGTKVLRDDSLPVSQVGVLADVEAAFEGVYSTDINRRIMAMQTLVSSSPVDAVNVIHELLDNLRDDRMAEGMVALGLLSLANNSEAFPNEDLEYIYHSYDNDNIRARSARVLSHRGDDALLKEYVSKYDTPVGNDLPSKNKAILELANLQSRVAIPYISKYLSDSNELVRLQALGAMEMTANIDDIELVRPLLYDSDEAVRSLSREVMNNLVGRGKQQPVPVDIMLHPKAENNPS